MLEVLMNSAAESYEIIAMLCVCVYVCLYMVTVSRLCDHLTYLSLSLSLSLSLYIYIYIYIYIYNKSKLYLHNLNLQRFKCNRKLSD